MDWIRLVQDGLASGSYEDVNEPLGSIKGKDFLGQLADYELLKNDFLPWSSLVSVLIGYCSTTAFMRFILTQAKAPIFRRVSFKRNCRLP